MSSDRFIKFDIGEIVRLRSGGPRMTVVDTKDTDDSLEEDEIGVVYFPRTNTQTCPVHPAEEDGAYATPIWASFRIDCVNLVESGIPE
jgi:hypothetical protein